MAELGKESIKQFLQVIQAIPTAKKISLGVITALVVATVGVVSSWEVLQRKPLATLRAE